MNSDGAQPIFDGLLQSGDSFIGSSDTGGKYGIGTLFEIAFTPNLVTAAAATYVDPAHWTLTCLGSDTASEIASYACRTLVEPAGAQTFAATVTDQCGAIFTPSALAGSVPSLGGAIDASGR